MNEADIIRSTVTHLLGQVDHVVVYDNLSTDGTYEILKELPVELHRDEEPGYIQHEKFSRWAADALEAGFKWVVPCDADEIWYWRRGTVKERLEAEKKADLVEVVRYDHVRTPLDPEDEPDPVLRLGWRKRHSSALKVACRLEPGLIISPGAHAAWYHVPFVEEPLRSQGLEARHFQYRDDERWVRRRREGALALRAGGLPESVAGHWRRSEVLTDAEVLAEARGLWSDNPRYDRSVVFDPAPVNGLRPRSPISTMLSYAATRARTTLRR
jgi:hypothetical protein